MNEVQAPAGCCWVRQCSVPRPRTRSRQAMPTTFAAGKQACERVEGYAIVRVVERWDDDEFVGDIKIGVAGGQALIIEINRRGMGSVSMRKGRLFRSFNGFQQRVVFLQRT